MSVASCSTWSMIWWWVFPCLYWEPFVVSELSGLMNWKSCLVGHPCALPSSTPSQHFPTVLGIVLYTSYKSHHFTRLQNYIFFPSVDHSQLFWLTTCSFTSCPPPPLSPQPSFPWVEIRFYIGIVTFISFLLSILSPVSSSSHAITAPAIPKMAWWVAPFKCQPRRWQILSRLASWEYRGTKRVYNYSETGQRRSDRRVQVQCWLPQRRQCCSIDRYKLIDIFVICTFIHTIYYQRSAPIVEMAYIHIIVWLLALSWPKPACIQLKGLLEIDQFLRRFLT